MVSIRLLKRLLEEEGREVFYPKKVLREAYVGRLIDQEALWLQMLVDRNLTFHTYNAQLADRIYQHIKEIHYPLMRTNFAQLQKYYQNES